MPPNPAPYTPRVSAAIRGLNKLGPHSRVLRARAAELTEADVLRAARRQTGLDDPGDQRFLTPLRLLLESYREDPELTFAGRLIARGLLVHHVANRMELHRDLSRSPAILEGEIRRPLLVVGLPRTGTTLLYNLLAQDEEARPLMFWESMAPSRPAGRRDARIGRAVRTVRRLNMAVPGLAAIHEMDPRGPDECLGLLLNTFVTPFFRGRVPRYREWLYALGDDEIRAAYREYRQQLLLLQAQRAGGHWLLKCPSHLFGLKALLEVFPDACVVQTHRDPAEAVPSLCSLTAALDAMSYRTIDPAEVGRRDLAIAEQLVRRGMEARDAAGPGRVLDVHYRDFTRDPAGTVRRIYEHFGYPLDPGMDRRMQEHLAANPQHRHGVHRYTLEDFGLSRDLLHERFAPYRERFGIEAAPAGG